MPLLQRLCAASAVADAVGGDYPRLTVSVSATTDEAMAAVAQCSRGARAAGCGFLRAERGRLHVPSIMLAMLAPQPPSLAHLGPDAVPAALSLDPHGRETLEKVGVSVFVCAPSAVISETRAAAFSLGLAARIPVQMHAEVFEF